MNLRTTANLALALSILACALAIVTMFRNDPEGKLTESVKGAVEESKTVIREAKEKVASKLGEDKSDGETQITAPELPPLTEFDPPAENEIREALSVEKVKERLEKIEKMVREKDGRAGEYIDKLKTDLTEAGRYSSETIKSIFEKLSVSLGEVKERIAEDTPAAQERLRNLKEELLGGGEAEEGASEAAAEASGA